MPERQRCTVCGQFVGLGAGCLICGQREGHWAGCPNVDVEQCEQCIRTHPKIVRA